MYIALSVLGRTAYVPGKTKWPPSSFEPLEPAGICGKTSAVQPGFFATAAAASSLGETLAQDPVGERGQVRTVLLEHAAREKHDGLRAIERANLRGVQVGDAHDLGGGRRAAARQGQQSDTKSAAEHECLPESGNRVIG